MNSNDILNNIKSTAFTILKSQTKDFELDDLERLLETNHESLIHKITSDEIDKEGWFFVYFNNGIQDYNNIGWEDFEVIKVYKTDKILHILEFFNKYKNHYKIKKMLSNEELQRPIATSDYELYNYYDKDLDYLYNESFFYRNSSEAIGIKLPKEFNL